MQGAKRSDWTAQLHLFELIPYLALLWICLNLWGIAGAAFAWCMRAAIDLMGLVYFSKKLNPLNWVSIKTPLFLLAAGSIALLPSLSEVSLSGRIFFVITLLGLYCIPTFKQLRKDKILGMLK